MKKLTLIGATILALGAGLASAQDKLTLQLKWVTQPAARTSTRAR
jgi:hypothetical protein